jgi:selenocysteine lyase/cysteine desulfurase
VFVDAVQSVPHLPVDVAELGCDFLVCSPYKFFGPHQGVLWGRGALLEQLDAYKVRPASIQPAAVRFETGTQSFEAQAALLGTIAYLEWLGREAAPGTNGERRGLLRTAMEACRAYEEELSERLLAGLTQIEGLRLYGSPTTEARVPTFAFTLAGCNSRDVAAALGEAGIFAWAGHFYAIETLERLQLADQGGLIRVGLCHYNEAREVDYLLERLRELAGQDA